MVLIHELTGKQNQESQGFDCHQAGDLQDWAVVEAGMKDSFEERPAPIEHGHEPVRRREPEHVDEEVLT